MLLITIFILVGIYCIFWYMKRWQKCIIINKIPGPKGYPIIGNMLAFLGSTDNILSNYRSWFKKYYPIYKYWILHEPVVNLLDPNDIEIIMATMKHSRKSIIYDVMQPWLGTGLLISDGSKWHQRRKILTPAFHFNILQQFLKVFEEQSKRLVKELEVEVNKDYTNILPIISQSTLESICETAMGTQLNKKTNKSKEYMDAVHKIGEIIIYRLTRIWCANDFGFAMSSLYKKHNQCIKILHNFTSTVIKERQLNFEGQHFSQDTNEYGFSKKKRLAMLDLLIDAKNSEKLIDDEGIQEEVNTFMFEGHDTTSACISFTLFALACHEDIQRRVYEESLDLFSNKENEITIQSLQKLTYLDLVIKESLRMFPSVPLISRVSDQDIQTATGYTIPKDVILQIHIFDLHRDPKIYPNPEIFDPERFLPKNSVGRHPFAYIPFSGGPRNCIGQKFAMLEIKIVLISILYNYILKPVDNFSSVSFETHLILKSKNGIKIKFCKRNL